MSLIISMLSQSIVLNISLSSPRRRVETGRMPPQNVFPSGENISSFVDRERYFNLANKYDKINLT